MPSFSDSAVIFFLALLLFGPKKLPELARYVGKLMGEFRRASSEFRLQMEDEFRVIEQAEQQKKIEAIEAAAPVTPLNIPEPEHPHMPLPLEAAEEGLDHDLEGPDRRIDGFRVDRPAPDAVEVVPIASNGNLHMKPPATGLPISRGLRSSAFTSPTDASEADVPEAKSFSDVFTAIPHTDDPAAVTIPAETEASTHG